MKFNLTLNLLSFLLFISLRANGVDHSDGIWRIKKDSWSESDEKRFSDFVVAMGTSGCNTTSKCINHPSNPYHRQNPSSLKNIFSDCADFPYVLRAYFAFMNDLPFSYIDEVAARGKSKDIRYSPNGNSAISRRIIQSGESVSRVLKELSNSISSAMFRIPPEENKKGLLATDLYSADLSPAAIKPGTVIYDPNGHVAVIYKIESDGRIRFMDGHPDNSVTRGVYGEKFARSRPTAGAGFKNWRPLNYQSGTVEATLNEYLRDYSLVQYYGTKPDSSYWSKGGFEIDGQSYEYYDFVRIRLAGGKLRFVPTQEFQNMLEALCQDSKDRVVAVNEAIANNIHRKPHPETLPNNIYGTHGEWETYSSPSRDARLKTSFRELHKKTESFIDLVAKKSDRVDYQGSVVQLKLDLLKLYDSVTAACELSYTNSSGIEVRFDLAEVEKRLWDLSFDPYHCVELRWGAKDAELESCVDSSSKFQWYAAQQRLRNQIDRTYDVVMGFNLRQLQDEISGSGVDAPPTVNIQDLLR